MPFAGSVNSDCSLFGNLAAMFTVAAGERVVEAVA
jgi:hypothetical protein